MLHFGVIYLFAVLTVWCLLGELRGPRVGQAERLLLAALWFLVPVGAGLAALAALVARKLRARMLL